MSNETYSKIFEPPQDLFGQLCVASALSADEPFIENALSTFTKSDCQSRLFDRSYSFFLMLNQGHRLLDKSISGLCQLEPFNQDVWSKISVQHAKVAIMQFGTNRMRRDYICEDDCIWRLVVCTGNWTEESSKNQIEMVWSIDVESRNPDEKDAADLFLASKFLKNLKRLYVCGREFWDRAQQMLDTIEKKCSTFSIKNSRFISSLPDFEKTDLNNAKGTCLFDGIIEKIKGHCEQYNRLIVGSGFYEQSRDDSKPKVLEKIESNLMQIGVTRSIEKHLVVNSDNAGQIASWVDKDWYINGPFDYSGKNRRLHAKYMFIGKSFGGNIKKWIMYVGSGNMSIMGLLSAYGVVEKKAGRGNIEAGVVFYTSEVLPIEESELYKALACCCDSEVEFNDLTTTENNSDEPPPVFVSPSPLYAIKLLGKNDKFIFLWNDSLTNTSALYSLEINGVKKSISSDKGIVFNLTTWNLYTGDLPQWICVIIDDKTYQVPIISEDGLLIETKKTLKNPSEWIDFLDNFPKNMDSEDEDNNGDDDGGDGDKPKRPSGSNDEDGQQNYPYQDAMRIVEGLANLNNRYFPIDGSKANCRGLLEDWIFQVENSVKCFPEDFRLRMKNIGINFLSVLKREDGFAPTLTPELRLLWNDCIDRWIKNWELPENNCIWEEERV